MKEYLHWLKPEDKKDAQDLFLVAIGFVGLFYFYMMGQNKGAKKSRKEFLDILKNAGKGKELTFVDDFRKGHGFTAKYF